MYRPTPPRHGPDKDLVIGIIAVVVFVIVLGGGAALFLLKDTFSPAAPTTPVVSFSTELQQAYTTFYEKGNLQEGISMYRGLTERFPKEAAAWREFATATSFLGTVPYSNTIGPLQKANQLDPQDTLTYYYLTKYYLTKYKKSEAAQYFQAATKISQGSWIDHAAAANYYLGTLDFSKVQPEIDAVQNNPGNFANDPRYNFTLANLFYENQDVTNALKYLDIPLTKWPNLAYPKILKAYCLLFGSDSKTNKANQAAAFDLILQAQKLQPNASFVYSALATYYTYVSQDTVSGEKYAQEYLKIEPEDTTLLTVLGRLALYKKDYDQSSKYFENCLKIDPDAWGCSQEWAWELLRQGYDLEGQGKDQEATVAYQAAIDKALPIKTLIERLPENNYTHAKGYFYYLLGSISYYMSDYSTATTYLEKAVSYSVDAYVYAYLGWSYIADNRVVDAQAIYEKGLSIDPDDSYLKDLGDQLMKLNKNG